MTPDEHLDDTGQLLPLLRGDVGRDELTVLSEHLLGCERCRMALVELIPAHAAISAAARTLRSAEAAARRPLPVPRPLEVTDDEPALPPLRRRRRFPVVPLAAAVIATGATVGIGAALLRDGSEPAPLAERSVALEPVTGEATGRVTMSDRGPDAATDMSITTAGLDTPPPGRFYYAWLFDPETNKMLPLGVVAPGDRTTFRVDDALVERYHAIDISLQDDNGDPAHSATSVLRAGY